MSLTMQDKLDCMTTNRNALKEEIEGLHLYINKLHRQLGRKPIFKTPPEPAAQADSFKCQSCDNEIIINKTCPRCQRLWES